MRVIVCGGRDLPETGPEAEQYISLLCSKLESVGASAVISGMARGGDHLGEAAADRMGLPIERHPAQWHKWGKKAGILRNLEMLTNADGTIALPGGKGTDHMKRSTLRDHKPLWVIHNPKQQEMFG